MDKPPPQPPSRELDSILKEFNAFGLFQIIYYLLIIIHLIVSESGLFLYAITTSDLKYRCYIEGCDSDENSFNSKWVSNAVPFENEKPLQCFRYAVTNKNQSNLQCEMEDAFDRTNKIECDSFVYETEERTIVNDFNVTCASNKWKLSFVGTVHNVGLLINLLITGYLSDKYGRQPVFIFSIANGMLLGIVKSFSWNYISFLVIEFIYVVFSGGAYTAGFVLAMELVVPEHRSMGGLVLFSMGTVGNVLMALSLMLFLNWRIMLRVNLSLHVLIILCFWFTPESVRWLISKKRYKEAGTILLQIARRNNANVLPELKEMLQNRPYEIVLNDKKEILKKDDQIKQNHPSQEFKKLLKHPAMIFRILICMFCWITNTFVFFGMTLISTAIGGNKFSSFIIVQLIEIPACILVLILTKFFGRKFLQISSFLISGVALITYTFVGDIYWLKVLLFLIGKFSITFSFSLIYIYTAELFPTSLRSFLMALCSAFGRIGSIIAPQSPLLEALVKHLAVYFFSATALLAGILCLKFPETKNKKLPDTIEEALNMNKKFEEIIELTSIS